MRNPYFCAIPTPTPALKNLTPILGLIVRHTDCVLKDNLKEIRILLMKGAQQCTRIMVVGLRNPAISRDSFRRSLKTFLKQTVTPLPTTRKKCHLVKCKTFTSN